MLSSHREMSPAIYAEWRQLIVAFGVSGAKVHDARLVATMRVHAVTHILTLNTADFTRYALEVGLLNPVSSQESGVRSPESGVSGKFMRTDF